MATLRITLGKQAVYVRCAYRGNADPAAGSDFTCIFYMDSYKARSSGCMIRMALMAHAIKIRLFFDLMPPFHNSTFRNHRTCGSLKPTP